MSKEAQIRTRIVNELRRAQAKVVIMHIGPFSAAGEPDLIGCWQGHAFALEVKAPGGAVRPIQSVRLKEWERAGARTGVVQTVQEAIRVVIGQG